MRLDKFLSNTGRFTRSEATAIIRRGRVSVDGVVRRSPSDHIDENKSRIAVDGVEIGFTRFRYIMLNKPSGTVSTTEDMERSVMKLLPEECLRTDMFPCGRLDIDTVGLLIITNDGQTAHALLSPKHHAEKVYRFTCAPLGGDAVARLEGGLELSDFTSKPCKVEMDDPQHGKITVTEGKYHQVKRMFHAVGSEILSLERISFAGIPLDENLPRGQWRELTEVEVEQLLRVAEAK